MQLIEGKLVAEQIKTEIAKEVKELLGQGKRAPHLAAVLVGNDGGSLTYVGHKVKACEQVGFQSTLLHFEADLTEEQLLSEIRQLNNNPEIDGFIVQLPLPGHINEQKVLEAIDPQKDVDGFHPVNVGRMILGLPSYVSATPAGIVELLKRYQIQTSGKKCVVIGRSNIVGRPLSILLSAKGQYADATVTLCHSRTHDMASITREADILIAAIGIPGFVKADMVKDGAVVIDVGTTRVEAKDTKSGWRLKGDVDFQEVSPKCSFITPVPGGVGPMTIVSLLRNTLQATRSHS